MKGVEKVDILLKPGEGWVTDAPASTRTPGTTVRPPAKSPPSCAKPDPPPAASKTCVVSSLTGARDFSDPPLAMAFLDRVVDGAQIVKFRGQSYRAHRAQKPSGAKERGSHAGD